MFRRLPFHENARRGRGRPGAGANTPLPDHRLGEPEREERAGTAPTLPRFPAILDTGHNHNFSIRHQHLVNWASIDPAGVAGPRCRPRGLPSHPAVPPQRLAASESSGGARSVCQPAAVLPGVAGGGGRLPRTRPDSRRCPASSGCATWFAASSTWPLTGEAPRGHSSHAGLADMVNGTRLC